MWIQQAQEDSRFHHRLRVTFSSLIVKVFKLQFDLISIPLRLSPFTV